MKDNGKTIKHAVKENFGMWMAIFMKGNGKRTRQMVLVFIFM